jgi:hypothetical protein
MIDRVRGAVAAVWAALTSTRAKAVYVLAMVLFSIVAVLWLSVRYNGILSTIVYAFAFTFTLALFPIIVALFGGSTPGGGLIAKLHIALQAFAFNNHYLVEFDDKYEWCPGEEDRVYINGEWHDIDGGLDNKTVLGWRPFGLLRYKCDGTLVGERADRKALKQRAGGTSDPTADGGQVQRGGYERATRPEESGVDGTWLLNLERVYTRGVQKMGDIELIETAEEIIERGQVDDGTMASWGPVVTYLVSLVIGIITGYLFFAA